jgi:NADH:ubiquinone oxidoreductase subunit
MIKNFFIKKLAKLRYIDHIGNEYYHMKYSNNKEKRFILYSKEANPSAVPPMYHAWLHYLVNDIDEAKNSNHGPAKTSLINIIPNKNFYYPWQPKQKTN